MTEAATITELRPDRTNAKRQRRYRRRHRKRRPPGVTPEGTLTVTAAAVTAASVKTVTPKAASIASGAALLAAIALAAVSGYFGIVGMTAIFAAAAVPVMIMTGVLEAAKLVTAAWLARHWHGAPLLLRLPLAVMVLALMALTAIGTFGFLSRAHLDHQVAATEAIDRDAVPIGQRIVLAAAALQDFDDRIAQLDNVVLAATQRGLVRTASAIVGDQKQARAALEARRQAAAERLADLKIEQAGIEAQRARVAADTGPALYLAKLVGSNDAESAVRIITALIVFVLDPLAVLLAIAASS